MSYLTHFRSAKNIIFRKIKASIRLTGFDIIRYLPSSLGSNPYLDMSSFLDDSPSLNIVDAGANLGESTDSLLDFFPKARYFCFEPCVDSYSIVKNKFSSNSAITVLNIGLSEICDSVDFNVNEFKFLSSYLDLGAFGYGQIQARIPSDLISLDSFAEHKNLTHIHILKIDVCGLELSVLKGCNFLLDENRVKLILVQLVFTEIYQPLPSFIEIIDYLLTKNFSLVGIYRQHFQENRLSWADALLINTKF